MTGYFIRRFLLIIPTFLGITVAVFVIMHFVPGGPVERQIMRFTAAASSEGGAVRSAGNSNIEIPPEVLEEMRKFYGFDQPVHIRYIRWLKNVVMLDLGTSYVYLVMVWGPLKSTFFPSTSLFLTGLGPGDVVSGPVA